ncbi:MAG: exosortase A [Betaproteobacteria bacterium]
MPDNHTATPAVSPHEVAPVATPREVEVAEARTAPQSGPGIALTVVLLLAWVLVLYLPTTLSMVSIWERSETFAHGYVVFPIFLYLLWRQRSELATIERQPCAPALIGLLGAGAVWLVGEWVSAAAVSQLAMVAMVPFAVWAVLGTRVAASLCIPLFFLFFAVPFGEFLIPYMMNWTADFTVAAIQASGVPIYREGNYFMIPSGRWSVVEACSGLRYLIASFMVGCLYSYLTYRSTARRITFIVASIVVPIVANWLRAYIIVMLGHLSNNRIAVGVDHLIYGWVFFGIVMALLFLVGSRWREDDLPAPASGATTASMVQPISNGVRPYRRIWPMLLAVAALTAMWPPLQTSLDRGPKGMGAHVELARLGDHSGWVSVPGSVSDWRPDLSGASAELRQTFVKDGREVGLHVAIYRDQTREAKAITSTNQLALTSNQRWKQVGANVASATIDGQPFSVQVAQLAGPLQRLAVWQWFWANGRETSSEFLAKLYQALSVIQGHGDPVAWVVVYAPIGNSAEKADATLREFTTDMHGVIDAALRKAVAP